MDCTSGKIKTTALNYASTCTLTSAAFFVLLYRLPSLQSDLEDKREVSNGEGSMMAQQSQCGFFETSAKERVNIDECFHELVRRIKKFQIQGACDKKQAKKGGKKCIVM